MNDMGIPFLTERQEGMAFEHCPIEAPEVSEN